MYRFILCVCLVLAGCASTKQSQSNNEIRVTGEGKTFEQAKLNGFANAVEYAVGAVVVTDTEIQKRRLVKDEILKHSAGYVDDFTIVSRFDEPGHVTVVMDVKVKSSKIAERITNVKTINGEIKGERLGAQYKTFMTNKETGDQLLRKILNDYPKYAINIEKGDIQYQVTIHREPVIIIPYKVSWNYKYLQALNEALVITQDEKSRTIKQERVSISSKDPSAWLLGSTETYYFNDIYRAQMIKSSFVGRLYVNVTFKDAHGKVLKSGCDDGMYLAGPNITEPFRIDGNEVVEKEMHVTVRSKTHIIEHIATVEMSVGTQRCTIID